MENRASISAWTPRRGAILGVALSSLLSATHPLHSATVTWVAHVDGAWSNPANWSAGSLPGPGDDVIVDVPEAITVSYATLDNSIASLDLREVLRINGGRLTVTGTVQAANTLQISGGILKGATVGGLGITYTSGMLDGATVAAGAILKPSGANAYLTVVNGLTLDGLARIGVAPGSASSLSFSGTQTLAGTGEIAFVSASSSNSVVPAAGGTLTIGAGITIHGWVGTIGAASPTLALVNQGTIAADSSVSTITITGAAWRNSGLIQATASGAAIVLAGTDWCNAGVLQATVPGSRLDILGTTTTACLGDLRAAAGKVRIILSGVLDNTASTLSLFPAIGPCEIAGGKIVGGTISGADPAQLLYTSGTIDGVTLSAGTVLKPTAASAYLTVVNGLTLNGLARIGVPPAAPSSISFSGTQTLAGTGEVKFVSSSSGNVLAPSSGGTLTIGPGITIHGWKGTVGLAAPALPLINQATITADSSVSAITVTGAGWQNSAVIQATAPGACIALAGSGWCNSGVIQATVAGSRLDIAGSTTSACLGDFRAAAGKVRVVSNGTLDNSADTLSLYPTMGPCEMAGGKILGGTISGAGPAQLLYTSGTLDGVTLSLGTVLKPSGGYAILTVVNGLTLDGVARIGVAPASPSSILFSGTQTLAGTGEVKFVSSNGNNTLAPGGGGTLTVGPDITIHGWTGAVGAATLAFVNQGAVAADTSGGTLTLRGSTWNNSGGIRCTRGGGNMTCAAALVNTGSVLVDSARTLTLTGTFRQDAGSTTLDKAAISSTSPLDIRAGILRGTGSLSGGVLNSGSILPGFSPGTMSLQGDYSQSAMGVLRVDLAGTAPGAFDKLSLTGKATLQGTLAVDVGGAYVPAAGDSFVIAQYQSTAGLFTNLQLPSLPGGLGWRLRYRPQFLTLGVALATDIDDSNPPPHLDVAIPTACRAYPNEPNPFNPTTRIRFDLPAPGTVDVAIYDCAGRRVRRLLHALYPEAGRFLANWDGCDDRGERLPSGVYLYRFTAGSYSRTQRMVLVE